MVHSTSPSFTRNLSHVVHSHAGDHSASVDGVMRLSGSVSDWLISSFPSFHSHVWEILVSSEQNSHHVGHGTTWVGDTISSLWVEAELLGKDLHDLNFHHGKDWRAVVDMGTGVEDGDDQFSNLTNWIRTSVKLVEEEWVQSVN